MIDPWYTVRMIPFWQRVQVGTADECWEFSGSRNGNGYGTVRRDNKTLLAHRYMWFLCEGYWPGVCRHTCDNPGCCNPLHLLDGTVPENVQDMITHDRTWYQRGIASPNTRLTDAQVAEIRSRYAAGELQRVLAAAYGVCQAQISRIVRGEQRVI